MYKAYVFSFLFPRKKENSTEADLQSKTNFTKHRSRVSIGHHSRKISVEELTHLRNKMIKIAYNPRIVFTFKVKPNYRGA